MTTAALRRFVQRALNALRPFRAEADLDREIASHLALIEQDFVRRGLSAADARLAARRVFGGIDQAKEMHRDARSFAWLDDARRDVRYAARALARAPGFTVAAVLTLGLAIGGTTAVYSLCHAVLVRTLPYPDSERLVLVFEDSSQVGFPRNAIRPRNFVAWAAEADVFASLAAVADHGTVLGGQAEPERIVGRRVTRSFFDVLGRGPLLGRVFSAHEDQPGGPRVVILSHRLWQRRFAGDPAMLGRPIPLDGQPHVVVGIMPPEFQFLDGYVGLWVPAALGDDVAHHGRYLTVVGRLRDGVDVAAARAALDTIATRTARVQPGDQPKDPLRSVVVSLKEYVTGDARRPLLVTFAAVAVLLLVACANLAGLLLARAAARRQELELRRALGASRGRVIRQLLAESLALAAMGLAAGIVVARVSFAFLEQLVPPAMALFTRPSLDWSTLAVAAVVAISAGVLFGLAPALQLTADTSGEALKAGGRVTAGSQRAPGRLVIGQVAMTLVLLVSAGLLLQTMYRLRYAGLGLRPDGLLTLRTTLPPGRYDAHAARMAFYDRVLERVERLPGVTAAGYSTSIPLEWRGGTSAFALEGRARDLRLPYDANHRQISAGYLQAMGIPLIGGRHLEPTDDARAHPVVVVNEALAQLYWPGEDPIGRRIAIDPPPAADRGRDIVWRTVVGVVGSTRQMGLDVPPRPEIYLPYRQFGEQPWFTPRDLVVRTTGDPASFTNAVKQAIHAVDPMLAVSNVRTFDEVLDEDVASRRTGTILLLAFAGFALLLSGVGIYGVVAYFVVQHVPELGVRLALGAGAADILHLVIRKGLRLAAAGTLIGALASVATTRAMSGLLYGFTGTGLMYSLGAGAVLLTLALLASYVPARRATQVDPLSALRSE